MHHLFHWYFSTGLTEPIQRFLWRPFFIATPEMIHNVELRGSYQRASIFFSFLVFKRVLFDNFRNFDNFSKSGENFQTLGTDDNKVLVTLVSDAHVNVRRSLRRLTFLNEANREVCAQGSNSPDCATNQRQTNALLLQRHPIEIFIYSSYTVCKYRFVRRFCDIIFYSIPKPSHTFFMLK